jgi:hypothetical protein
LPYFPRDDIHEHRLVLLHLLDATAAGIALPLADLSVHHVLRLASRKESVLLGVRLVLSRIATIVLLMIWLLAFQEIKDVLA